MVKSPTRKTGIPELKNNNRIILSQESESSVPENKDALNNFL
jgi:hypothetical protein